MANQGNKGKKKDAPLVPPKTTNPSTSFIDAPYPSAQLEFDPDSSFFVLRDHVDADGSRIPCTFDQATRHWVSNQAAKTSLRAYYRKQTPNWRALENEALERITQEAALRREPTPLVLPLSNPATPRPTTPRAPTPTSDDQVLSPRLERPIGSSSELKRDSPPHLDKPPLPDPFTFPNPTPKRQTPETPTPASNMATGTLTRTMGTTAADIDADLDDLEQRVPRAQVDDVYRRVTIRHAQRRLTEGNTTIGAFFSPGRSTPARGIRPFRLGRGGGRGGGNRLGTFPRQDDGGAGGGGGDGGGGNDGGGGDGGGDEGGDPPADPDTFDDQDPFADPPDEPELKLSQPKPYDGSAAKAEQFITACELWLTGRNIRAHRKRIMFVLHLCETGSAWAWARRKLQTAEPQTWGEFRDEFIRTFLTVDRRTRAMQKLKRLSQRGPVTGYVTDFQLLAQEAGLYDQGALLYEFQEGLNPLLYEKIKNLEAGRPKFTLDEWYRMAIDLDQAYLQTMEFQRNRRRPGNEPYRSSQPSSDSTRTYTKKKTHGPRKMYQRQLITDGRTPPTSSHDTVDEGYDTQHEEPKKEDKEWLTPEDCHILAITFKKLTPEERKRCRDKKLCFICQKPDHMAHQCPDRRQPPKFQKRKQNRNKHVRQLYLEDTDADDEEEDNYLDTKSHSDVDEDSESDNPGVRINRIYAGLDPSQQEALLDRAAEANF